MKKVLILLSCTLILTSGLFASDRSDADALIKKCNSESRVLEVCVRNFGNDKDIQDFEKGVKLIKMGKIKYAQSKFLDSKSNTEKYLKIQYSVYESLAKKYIKRTEQMIDDIALELIDYADDEKVMKNLSLASQYLSSAKSNMTRKFYSIVIGPSRKSKSYLLQLYDITGTPFPEKYAKDRADCSKKIYTN